eukprot:s453_g14.t1
MKPSEEAETEGGGQESRPNEIHVPGSDASTFSGRGILQSMLRHLLRSRCRLGAFSRSLLAWQFALPTAGVTGLAELFPLPVPYPEVFDSKPARCDKRSTLKKGVVAVVIVLNYLYLNRPKHVGDAFGGRRTLSRRQWEAIHRIEKFLQAWIDVSLITPEAMGRTSGKVESIEHMLAELQKHASSLAKPGAGYFQSPPQHDAPGKPVPCPTSKGKIFPGEAFSAFKQVEASRLSFGAKPEFDPSPFLDPQSREIFQDPLKCRLPPEECSSRPPKLRVHCSRTEKIKLFTLFSVPKDLERDRLILDSRGANMLEVPPAKWIKSLASAETLCKINLEEDEWLACSGNDLKDFYYAFRATTSRSRRNVLCSAMHPKELCGLKALRSERLQSKVVYPALNTLAMGDTQAVELAQSCHLGLALQNRIVDADSLMTMYKPVPRVDTMVGLVIDDFITLSKVKRAEFCAGFSEGAIRAEKMQSVYQEVKLVPNVKKGFRDELRSSFWGADVDGENGMIRGSLKRAVPLAGIILRLVRVGHCSGELMQIVVGSIISLFLFRRRLLSLLDSCFESYRGRPMDEIFPLTGRCKSDLLTVVVLLPMAATNIRASTPELVAAADASNWGEAGVWSRIPKCVGKELIRHCLRKSVWARLLTPSQAVLRGHGLLPEDEELPDENECFQSNALWACLAECLDYELLYARAKTGSRHINIGEVRSVLRTEKLLSLRHASCRILVGADSQVALGALIKGRSSSPAINDELVRSLPWMLCLDSYLDLMYFNTKSNRADDPTRGKAIARASRELPEWWADLSRGCFQSFDVWLHEHGLDAETLSELPSYAELCGEVSPPGILPGYLRQEHACEQMKVSETAGPVSKSEKAAVQVDTPLPGSTSSAQLRQETVKIGRGVPSVGCEPSPVWRPNPEEQPLPHGIADKSSAGSEEEPAGAASPSKKRMMRQKRRLAPLLSIEAREALRKFGADQVVRSAGVSWPPKRAGFLDLFSGERGVAVSLSRQCCTWSLCFDLEHSPLEDLDDANLRDELIQLIRLGCFIGAGGGPVCSSFSMAVRPAVRTSQEPYGKSDMSDNMRAKVQAGNSMALWFFKLLDVCLHAGLVVWLENPTASWMFRLPEWKEMLRKWPVLKPWIVDYCRYGTKWRKRTKFFSNTMLGNQKTLCRGCKEHQLLKGRSQKHKMSWTRVAQAYPVGVCRAVAKALAMKSELIEDDRHFDPGACAKAGSGRVGEASNPGPRRPRGEMRTGLLSEVPLVEPRTLEIQDKVWRTFLEWMRKSLSSGAVRSAMVQPTLLVYLAREYGNYLYSSGKSLFVFRHLLVFLQQNFATARPYMNLCWSMVSRWEMTEPTIHRTPLPFSVFKAMIAVALGWKWYRFTGVLTLGFLGIARPGEPLAACRRDLVLPRDMLSDDFSVAYLRILKPKTRHRGGGRTQHLAIHENTFVELLDAIFGDLSPEDRLLECSPSAFRRRWDAILSSLKICKDSGLTPGGVRGGGCVYAFQSGVSLPTLLWRMRIRHLQTLESYLQEVVASTVVSELSEDARKIFRVLRLLRAGRLLISVPELYILVSGLTTSIKAIFFGSIMLASVVFVWAIVMVELVHPLNVEIDYTQTLCPRCPRSFSTVYSSSLTLFSQIVAGDGWGTLSLPLAEAHPWLSVFLFAIMISISLGVMNLILAVIVEKAAEARQNDLDRKLAQKNLDREKNMIELALLCDRMDTDKSGALSLEEMLHGYVSERKFYTLMQESGIEKDDIQTMFNVLDANNSGEVDYLEFCNLLGRCPKRDPMMLAAMTRYSVMELRKILQQDIVEAVREQTELLKEQLDLLCYIPQCEAAGRALQKRGDERRATKLQAPRATLGVKGGSDGFSELQTQLEELSLWATQVELAEIPKSPLEVAGVPRGFLERPDSRSSIGSSQVTAKTGSSVCRNFSVAGQWNEIDRQFQQLNGKFDEQLRREKEMEEKCKRLMEDLSSTLEGKSWVIKEDL